MLLKFSLVLSSICLPENMLPKPMPNTFFLFLMPLSSSWFSIIIELLFKFSFELSWLLLVVVRMVGLARTGSATFST